MIIEKERLKDGIDNDKGEAACLGSPLPACYLFIGWRTLKGMKKQHYFRYGYNGDSYMHCRASTQNPLSVSGTSTILIELNLLIKDNSLPKCKKCEKEERRIKNINSYR